MHLFCSLLEGNSATRANVSTSSALGANVRINRIVFAFRDSAHRALIDTRTASDTIGRNFVSHKSIYLFCYFLIFSFATAKVVLFFDTTKFSGENFYFFGFLAVARAAASWAAGPVKPLSVRPLRVA